MLMHNILTNIANKNMVIKGSFYDLYLWSAPLQLNMNDSCVYCAYDCYRQLNQATELCFMAMLFCSDITMEIW